MGGLCQGEPWLVSTRASIVLYALAELSHGCLSGHRLATVLGAAAATLRFSRVLMCQYGKINVWHRVWPQACRGA